MKVEREYISYKQAAAICGIAPSSIAAYVSKGLLIGGAGRIPKAEALRYCRERRSPGKGIAAHFDLGKCREMFLEQAKFMLGNKKHQNSLEVEGMALLAAEQVGHSPYYIHRVTGIPLIEAKRVCRRLFDMGIWEGSVNNEADWIAAKGKIKEGDTTSRTTTEMHVGMCLSALVAAGEIARIERADDYCMRCGLLNTGRGWLCVACVQPRKVMIREVKDRPLRYVDIPVLEFASASEIRFPRHVKAGYFAPEGVNTKEWMHVPPKPPVRSVSLELLCPYDKMLNA